MKKTLIKFFDKIILLLLGLSGTFYACYKYGMPVDEYELRGTVTDSSLTPIRDIRIIDERERDTLYTDATGKFVINSWIMGDMVRLKLEDIDGEANGGEFRPTTVNVKFTEKDIVKKAKGNKRGNKFAKNQDIKLYRMDEEITVLYGMPVAPFEP